MKQAHKIEPQDWMKEQGLRAVLEALGLGNALMVGGCVRNVLLGHEVEDIDIACKHAPDKVTDALEAAGIKAVPTGIDHGTVTAVTDGKGYEVTSLRKDVETDGRRAVVAFTDDWLEDAKRRDFTMNTLLMDHEGCIFDPLGSGLDDLQAKKVVFVGKPEERIAEDTLRVLRYFRFHGQYAKGEPDENALKACAEAAKDIPSLSKERITQEFLKILSVEKPAELIKLMFDHGILKELCFDEYEPDLLESLCHFQKQYALRSAPIRIVSLSGLRKENVSKITNFLLLPKLFQKDIKAIFEVLSMADLSNEQQVKEAIYKYGRTATAQCLMLELAQDRVMNSFAADALDLIRNWDIPNFPISGYDLIKKGLKPGPELGAELERLENEWIEGGFN